MIKRAFYGLFMGIADAVPGVSGGTVALLLGIYPQLLKALRRFDWRFLLPLFLGIGSGLVGFSHVIRHLLHHELGRPYLFSLFIGLILASALSCLRRISRWRWREGVALLSGVSLAFFVAGLRAPEKGLYHVQLPQGRIDSTWERAANFQPLGRLLLDLSEREVAGLLDRGEIDQESLLFRVEDEKWGPARLFLPKGGLDLFAAGAGFIAGSAMLLPGLSGAYVLALLGYYELAIKALSDLSLTLLLPIALGALAGMFCCARAVSWLFSRFESIATALLVGLMLGALRALYPFTSFEWRLDPLHLNRGLELTALSPEIPLPSTLLFWGALLFVGMGFCGFWLLELRRRA